MVPTRYQLRNPRTGRRSIGIIECGLVLSVILGLGFVSLRIMNMDAPSTWSQTAVASPTEATADAAASTDTPSVAKTP